MFCFFFLHSWRKKMVSSSFSLTWMFPPTKKIRTIRFNTSLLQLPTPNIFKSTPPRLLDSNKYCFPWCWLSLFLHLLSLMKAARCSCVSRNLASQENMCKSNEVKKKDLDRRLSTAIRLVEFMPVFWSLQCHDNQGHIEIQTISQSAQMMKPLGYSHDIKGLFLLTEAQPNVPQVLLQHLPLIFFKQSLSSPPHASCFTTVRWEAGCSNEILFEAAQTDAGSHWCESLSNRFCSKVYILIM